MQVNSQKYKVYPNACSVARHAFENGQNHDKLFDLFENNNSIKMGHQVSLMHYYNHYLSLANKAGKKELSKAEI